MTGVFYPDKFYKRGNSFVSMLKKILTQEEKARRSRRNQILVGGVLIVLMIVSTLGYSLMSGDGNNSGDRVTELGINFVRDGGLWKIVINGARAGVPSEEGIVFGFQYLPSEIGDVFVSGDYDFGDYNGKVLYFVNGSEGSSEILNNLGRYVLRYQSACLNGTICGGDLPLKSCDDNLIIFESGNETSVWKEDNCVHIVGDGVRGADAFLYKALKIS